MSEATDTGRRPTTWIDEANLMSVPATGPAPEIADRSASGKCPLRPCGCRFLPGFNGSLQGLAHRNYAAITPSADPDNHLIRCTCHGTGQGVSLFLQNLVGRHLPDLLLLDRLLLDRFLVGRF